MIVDIKNYFSKALKGQLTFYENLFTLCIPAYLVQFFIVGNIIKIKGLHSLDILIVGIAVIYFILHIVICRKTQKVNKAQLKDNEDSKEHTNVAKSISEKILLKKPIVKSDNFNTLIAIDLLLIVINLDYVV